jgi:hypothetical protein
VPHSERILINSYNCNEFVQFRVKEFLSLNETDQVEFLLENYTHKPKVTLASKHLKLPQSFYDEVKRRSKITHQQNFEKFMKKVEK